MKFNTLVAFGIVSFAKCGDELVKSEIEAPLTLSDEDEELHQLAIEIDGDLQSLRRGSDNTQSLGGRRSSRGRSSSRTSTTTRRGGRSSRSSSY